MNIQQQKSSKRKPLLAFLSLMLLPMITWGVNRIQIPPAQVIVPVVPSSATFAGEKVEFNTSERRERMDRELISFSYMHTNVLLTFKRANRYFPIVEPILRQNGIPDDFKYLMAIESNASPTARSSAGAVGLWQFMSATAKEYGLEVNDEVDERLHPVKATQAACRYFKQAYARFGNWLSVAASYNAGQRRIGQAVEKQQTTNPMELWLNEETSRYLYRLLAIKIVMSSPADFGFRLTAESLYPTIKYDINVVTDSIGDLTLYARRYGLSLLQLKEANPWLRGHELKNKLGKRYEIAIPKKESLYYNPSDTKVHDSRWIVR